jgi:PBP1b-binding outer membrane lipoprotein LpoB
VILSAALILSGCFGSGKDSDPKQSESPKTEKLQTIKSTQSDLSIEVAESWKQNDTGGDTAASISLISEKEDLALIVIEEKTSDFDKELTPEKYADMLVEVMKETEGASNWQVDALTDVTIGDGVAAKQRTISVTMDGVNLKYLQTICKTDDYFVAILEWTTPSKFDGTLQVFNDILATVKFNAAEKAS